MKRNHGSVMEYEDPHPEEDPRYVEACEEFDRLSRNATFARARLVQQIHDEKLFGPWGTFENCMVARLKITARYAPLPYGCIGDPRPPRGSGMPASSY
jgi:hypothetical protein